MMKNEISRKTIKSSTAQTILLKLANTKVQTTQPRAYTTI